MRALYHIGGGPTIGPQRQSSRWRHNHLTSVAAVTILGQPQARFEADARICVYCSPSSAVDPPYVSVAQELGRGIAERGHVLVYRGANVGLVGELALGVKERRDRVIGVLQRRLSEQGPAFLGADELIEVATMADRKQAMEERAETLGALPGGFGTLEELLQAITIKRLGYLQVPIVPLNCAREGSSERFYDPLLAFFE